jgi:hypothetical protein
MDKKSFRPCFVNIPALFVLCLLLFTSARAQQNDDSEKSLGDLFEDFKTTRKLPCGQRDEALRVGRLIVEKYSHDEINKDVIAYVQKLIPQIEALDKVCKDEFSLENLYARFTVTLKAPCGDRFDAVRFGKTLLQRYEDDVQNREVIEYVRKKLEPIEKEDRICRLKARYDNAYKTKYWNEFFVVSKEIIAEEGDKPLALDVILTLVSVGFDLTAYEKDDFYNADTVSYAQKAIELIENGTKTQACWGIFECYENREKALGWLNYTIGYISYFRLKGDKKAIPYFYKAARYEMEFKDDAFVYQAVAIYYFDKEASMASSLDINSFITKAQSIANPIDGTADNLWDEAAKNKEIVALYKNLVNLYNLHYNLAESENAPDLANYIQKLISRPLIDPSAKIRRKPKPSRIYRTQ